MNYLDQLKQEAEQRKAQEQADQQLRKQQEERFSAEVKPALECLRSYLHELTQQLNYLKPDAPVVYEIQDYGKLELLQQQDYRVLTHEQNDAQYKSYDNPSRNRKEFSADRYNFFWRCQCVGRYKIRIEKRKVREMNLQKEYLLKYRFKYTCTEETNQHHQFIKAIFIVEPLIPVEFNFTGDLVTCAIDLTVNNFPELGEKVYTLSPPEVNDAFLDNLAKYLTRQPNSLSLREKERWKRYPLSPKEKDLLQFELWLHHTQRELGEPQPLSLESPKLNDSKDFEQFEEWLRHQETQLAQVPQRPQKLPMLSQLLNKVKLFKLL